jgi:hypothetical protein
MDPTDRISPVETGFQVRRQAAPAGAGTLSPLAACGCPKHRDEAKRLLNDGTDPSEAKREAKRAQAQSGDTFRSIAEEYVSKLTKKGRAQAT